MTTPAQTQQQGQWPPRHCGMPDLSGLNSKVILTLMLNSIFRGTKTTDAHESALVSSYVRLTDKSLLAYQSTRSALLEYVNAPSNRPLSALFRAIDYMETCVGSMKRALLFANAIADRNGQLVSPNHPLLASDAFPRLKKIRNAIEHMDERIADGKAGPGTSAPMALLVKSDNIELSGEEISYQDLSQWLTQLHQIAEDLVKN